jgi:hypothetical protein
MKTLLNSKKATLLAVCSTCLLVVTNASGAEIATGEAQIIADAISYAGSFIGTCIFSGLTLIAIWCK